MDTIIIGSGNVATVLARLMKKNNHHVLQVISKHISHAENLATELECDFSNDLSSLNTNASLYIIAVNDTAIEQIATQLKLNDKLVLHTCGSASKDVLKTVSENYGVLYPLQSLRKENKHIPPIPFLIDGNNAHAKKEIAAFAKTISPMASEANDEERIKLHISAVVVSNFTNHLYALTQEYCNAENINFSLLHPLIMETAQRLFHYNPADMQTGPAARGDLHTIEQHQKILKDYPQLQHLYAELSKSILQDK